MFSKHFLPPVMRDKEWSILCSVLITSQSKLLRVKFLNMSAICARPIPTSIIDFSKKPKLNPPPCLHNNKRAQGQSNMSVNHTEWSSAQIEFYKVQCLIDWMRYATGGASVMDYQALFQESIQQETLLKNIWMWAFKQLEHLWPTEQRRIHWFRVLLHCYLITIIQLDCVYLLFFLLCFFFHYTWVWEQD